MSVPEGQLAAQCDTPQRRACLPARHVSNPHLVRPAAIRTPRKTSCPGILQTPRAQRVARPRPDETRVETSFMFVGNLELSGWQAGQVPIFLEWFPEKLDRRSEFKFFESGMEYTVGRARTCDIYLQGLEPGSGISSTHLKIKVCCSGGRRLMVDGSCPWTC
jgi:hypothetical protein